MFIFRRTWFILFFFPFQISSKEAIWISFGVLALSILISTPFIVISELKIMFLKPGAYDHIAFCAEDLSQWGQVCTYYVNLCNWGPHYGRFLLWDPTKKGQKVLHQLILSPHDLNDSKYDLKWLQMTLYVSNKLTEIIWDHLESFNSWGDKIINMQRLLSFFCGVSGDSGPANYAYFLSYSRCGLKKIFWNPPSPF